METNQNGMHKQCEENAKSSEFIFCAELNNTFHTPDSKLKCTWRRENSGRSPHTKRCWKRTEKILPDVFSLIGNTPLVKLNKIPQTEGIKCNIYVKCEYLNPGGSIKDRIAKRMVEDAEKHGILKPGDTLIEPSSGNTGIGVALAAAIKGYRCIIVICEKMSNEKISVLNALGAEIIRTPITADSYSPEGIFGVAHRLHKEIPNSVILDQFSNPGNPLAHYDTTAEEILDQCSNQVDMIVMGAGTGGTVTGIGRKFKEKSPNTKIVAADPEGSVFALPESLNKTDVTFFEVEGLGYDFVPTVLDQRVVDTWIKTNDKDSLIMARRLIREEGLLIGTSSGAAVTAALKVAKDLKEGQNVVVILPDSIRNYITKFACDQWMEARLLQPCINKKNHWWWNENVNDVKLNKVEKVSCSTSCGEVESIFNKSEAAQVALIKDDGNMLGVVTTEHLLGKLICGDVFLDDKIEKIAIRIYPKAEESSHLGLVSRILEKDSYVIITKTQGIGKDQKITPLGSVDCKSLYDYISREKVIQNGNH